MLQRACRVKQHTHTHKMHTILTRGNAILAYTLSVLAFLTFSCFLSTVFLDYRTDANLKTGKILVYVFPGLYLLT